MRYLYQRGHPRRVVHLCFHDPRTGEPTLEPICGRVHLQFDTTANVPFGRPTCRWCLKEARR